MPVGTVAVLGASNDRRKFGNKAVRAYVSQDWVVYPVNPKESTVEGLKSYASIRDVPQPLDRVSVYLMPQLGIRLLEDIAAVKPHEVFFNPGSESPELLDKARALGLNAIVACSIVDIGVTPSQFPSP